MAKWDAYRDGSTDSRHDLDSTSRDRVSFRDRCDIRKMICQTTTDRRGRRRLELNVSYDPHSTLSYDHWMNCVGIRDNASV